VRVGDARSEDGDVYGRWKKLLSDSRLPYTIDEWLGTTMQPLVVVDLSKFVWRGRLATFVIFTNLSLKAKLKMVSATKHALENALERAFCATLGRKGGCLNPSIIQQG